MQVQQRSNSNEMDRVRRKLTRLKSPLERLLHLFLVPECDFNLGYQSAEEVAKDLEPERKPAAAFSSEVIEVEKNIEIEKRNGCCWFPPPRVSRYPSLISGRSGISFATCGGPYSRPRGDDLDNSHEFRPEPEPVGSDLLRRSRQSKQIHDGFRDSKDLGAVDLCLNPLVMQPIPGGAQIVRTSTAHHCGTVIGEPNLRLATHFTRIRPSWDPASSSEAEGWGKFTLGVHMYIRSDWFLRWPRDSSMVDSACSKLSP